MSDGTKTIGELPEADSGELHYLTLTHLQALRLEVAKVDRPIAIGAASNERITLQRDGRFLHEWDTHGGTRHGHCSYQGHHFRSKLGALLQAFKSGSDDYS